MAKEDATEQVKEVLRQCIKHRFWISIGFAALFAIIAYFMGSGPVKASADKERKNIKDAENGVKAYQTPDKPTDAYKPIVVEKTEILNKDYDKAWKELYDRQAPLLTWPEIVQDRFRKWGRTWPENEDRGKVRLAIVDYIEAYPAYVDLVYKTFDPFDYETGKGIVAAPSKEQLLMPAQFSVESMPSLGKVWAAQERLWIQRTVLEVIRQVNKKATNWDSAIVKQIDVLQVASQAAQDQRSMANNETLTKAPDILAPGQAAATEDTSGGGAGMGMAGGASGSGSMMQSMMSGAGMRRGMGGMGMGGGVAQADDSIYYVEKGKSKILPVSITVLIDQDHVQDLLVELENSPMSIQVMDFELERPSSRVTKPEKGEQPGGMGGMMGGMMGSMGMGRMMRGMMGGGYGGMASQMRNQMMSSQMSMMGGMRMGMQGMGMGGMGGMGGAGRAEHKKVDVSNVNRKEEREKKAKELEEKKGPTLFDPYFNIVQVTVYGQARFFDAPPIAPPAEPSLGDAAASPAAPGATDQTPPGTPAPAGKTAAPAAAEKAAAPRRRPELTRQRRSPSRMPVPPRPSRPRNRPPRPSRPPSRPTRPSPRPRATPSRNSPSSGCAPPVFGPGRPLRARDSQRDDPELEEGPRRT